VDNFVDIGRRSAPKARESRLSLVCPQKGQKLKAFEIKDLQTLSLW
jgi:hypothetical protein